MVPIKANLFTLARICPTGCSTVRLCHANKEGPGPFTMLQHSSTKALKKSGHSDNLWSTPSDEAALPHVMAFVLPRAVFGRDLSRRVSFDRWTAS